MAVTSTSTSGFGHTANLPDYYFNAKWMEHGQANYVFRDAAKKIAFPKNSGTKIKIRRRKRIILGGTITEGTNPSSTTLEVESTNATVSQYGQFAEFTDMFEDTEDLPASAQMYAADAVAEAGTRLDDVTIQTALMAGTSVVYGGGAASRGALTTSDVLTTDILRDAIALLDVGSDAAGDGGAMRMENGLYGGIIHSKHKQDLYQDSTWLASAVRQNLGALEKGLGNKFEWNEVLWRTTNFGPHLANIGAPTLVDAVAVTGTTGLDGLTITVVNGSGSLTSATAHYFKVTRKHKKKGFEDGISSVMTLTSAATGNNESFTYVMPTDTNYTYAIYVGTSSGTQYLVSSGLAAAASGSITTVPTSNATAPAHPSTTVGNVYTSYVFGAESFSVIDLDKMKMIRKKGADSYDQLDLKRSVGTKWVNVPLILNNAWIIRIEAPSNH